MRRAAKTRQCVACRALCDQSELLRITVSPEGILPETGPHSSGRSAYVCRNQDCIEKALKRGLLAKSLKTTVSAALSERLKEAVNDGT